MVCRFLLHLVGCSSKETKDYVVVVNVGLLATLCMLVSPSRPVVSLCSYVAILLLIFLCLYMVVSPLWPNVFVFCLFLCGYSVVDTSVIVHGSFSLMTQ